MAGIPIFWVVGIPSFYLEFDSNRGFVNFKMQIPMVWPIFLVAEIPICFGGWNSYFLS